MMVFKRKQIVVLSLVIMIVVAGYLQYTYKQTASSSGNDSGKLGEAVYVDNNVVNGDLSNSQKTVTASKQANDYFINTRLDKDMTREKNTEKLKFITEDINATQDVKAKAYDQMMDVIETSDTEARIEQLIKEKGFEDILVMFGEDKSVDVVVKAPYLTSIQTAQISDIVTRQANIPMTGVHVRIIY